MNLRPFDLSAALNGEPVVDGFGDAITGFHVFREDSENVYAWDSGLARINKYTKDGWCINDDSWTSDRRCLYMAQKQPRKYYVNVYRNDVGLPTFGAVYPDKQSAERVAQCSDMQDYVSTIELEV